MAKPTVTDLLRNMKNTGEITDEDLWIGLDRAVEGIAKARDLLEAWLTKWIRDDESYENRLLTMSGLSRSRTYELWASKITISGEIGVSDFVQELLEEACFDCELKTGRCKYEVRIAGRPGCKRFVLESRGYEELPLEEESGTTEDYRHIELVLPPGTEIVIRIPGRK